jgi:LPXTG-site transpeptidase (sortase) family protein
MLSVAMKNREGASVALILFAIFGFSLSSQTFLKSAHADVSSAVTNDSPAWIYAPSIKLSSPIQGVGVTKNGAMDVPSGSGATVGWYEYGVVPGSMGTAVLDAHVFAAFKTLKDVKVGGDIYIYMASGKTYHYVVTKAKTYPITNLSSKTLFTPTSDEALNLITCAGTLTADRSTYTHRLIVSAKLL